MNFSLFSRATEKRGRLIDQKQLVEMILSPVVIEDTEEGKLKQPLLFSGPLPNNVRKNGIPEYISAVIVEHDAGDNATNKRQMTFREVCDKLAFNKISALVFTTWSHEDPKKPGPRWRVIFPLSEKLPVSSLMEYVEIINYILDGVLAVESVQGRRGWFIGARKGRSRGVEIIEGESLDKVVRASKMDRLPLPVPQSIAVGVKSSNRISKQNSIKDVGMTAESVASRQAAAAIATLRPSKT